MTHSGTFQIEIDGNLYTNAPLRDIDAALRSLEEKELAGERAAKRAGTPIERPPYARSGDFLSAPTVRLTRFQARIQQLTHCPSVEVRGIEWLLRDAHADPELLRTPTLIYEVACAYRLLRYAVTRAARGDAEARELLARINREGR